MFFLLLCNVFICHITTNSFLMLIHLRLICAAIRLTYRCFTYLLDLAKAILAVLDDSGALILGCKLFFHWQQSRLLYYFARSGSGSLKGVLEVQWFSDLKNVEHLPWWICCSHLRSPMKCLAVVDRKKCTDIYSLLPSYSMCQCNILCY